MYGNEINSLPPSKTFNKNDAGKALKDVRFCIKQIDLFFHTLQNIGNPDKDKNT